MNVVFVGSVMVALFFVMSERIDSKSGCLRMDTLEPSRMRMPPAAVAPVAVPLGVREGSLVGARLTGLAVAVRPSKMFRLKGYPSSGVDSNRAILLTALILER